MSNFICPTCGFNNIDCGKDGYKTDREIELEKKLDIAVKTLKEYANSNCWNDCLYNGRVKVNAYFQTAGYKTALQALNELKGKSHEI